jgi:hypothetical protein
MAQRVALVVVELRFMLVLVELELPIKVMQEVTGSVLAFTALVEAAVQVV